MLSINTNYSAAIALQNLTTTNKQLEEVQNRINTGLKVASAKDNGAVFAIAEQQKTRISSIAAVNDVIDRAASTIDVALAAGQKIGDLLKEMKQRAISAQAGDLTADQRAAIQADYDQLVAGINQIANAGQFNNMNLVAAGGLDLEVLVSDLPRAGVQIVAAGVPGVVPALNSELGATFGFDGTETVTFQLDGANVGVAVTIDATMTVQEYLEEITTATAGRVSASYNSSTGVLTYWASEGDLVDNPLTIVAANIAGDEATFLGTAVANTSASLAPLTTTVSNLDFTVGGAGALSLVSNSTSALATAAAAAAVSGNIDTALTEMNRQLASLGSQTRALGIQQEFLKALSDTVEKGIGTLVDADLAKESARLQALQIKQQLGAQALSIANQSPSIILNLFRS
jgi:flagellin